MTIEIVLLVLGAFAIGTAVGFAIGCERALYLMRRHRRRWFE